MSLNYTHQWRDGTNVIARKHRAPARMNPEPLVERVVNGIIAIAHHSVEHGDDCFSMRHFGSSDKSQTTKRQADSHSVHQTVRNADRAPSRVGSLKIIAPVMPLCQVNNPL